MKKIDIDEATLPQLMRFATTHLFLSLHPNTGREKTMNAIKEVWNASYILVQAVSEAEPLAEAVGEFQLQEDNGRKVSPKKIGLDPIRFSAADPRVLITVQEGAGRDGSHPVFTAVNGVGFLIPRGKKVEVPYRYFNVLATSEIDKIEDSFDKDGVTRVSRTVPCYPYTLHRGVSDEEVAKWKESIESYEIAKAEEAANAIKSKSKIAA